MRTERRVTVVCYGSNETVGKGEMTKSPISLQYLRRSLYVKAKIVLLVGLKCPWEAFIT